MGTNNPADDYGLGSVYLGLSHYATQLAALQNKGLSGGALYYLQHRVSTIFHRRDPQ